MVTSNVHTCRVKLLSPRTVNMEKCKYMEQFPVNAAILYVGLQAFNILEITSQRVPIYHQVQCVSFFSAELTS